LSEKEQNMHPSGLQKSDNNDIFQVINQWSNKVDFPININEQKKVSNVDIIKLFHWEVQRNRVRDVCTDLSFLDAGVRELP
jgi:hypothetical protein